MTRSSWLALLLAGQVLPGLAFGQNYVFGANVRVNDNQPAGSAWATTLSAGQHLIAARAETVYVTWFDDRTGDDQVYFARSNDGGVTFLPNVQVSRIGSGAAPSLAVDERGGVHTAWYDLNASHCAFQYYAKSTDGGRSFLSPVRACDSTLENEDGYSSIAVSRDGQRVYVVRDEFGHAAIYLSRSTDGGMTFLPDVEVTLDTTTNQSHPSVAIYHDTVVLIAADCGKVHLVRSLDGGATFGPYVTVSESVTDWEQKPSLTVDTAGRVYVMWDGYPLLAVSHDTGRTFSPAHGITSVGGFCPSVAASAGGHLYMSWDYGVANYGIRYAYSPDGGATILPAVEPYHGPGYVYRSFTTVAANADGRVFVAWNDNRNDAQGFNYDTYFASGTMAGIEEQPEPTALKLRCDVVPNPARGAVTVEYDVSAPGPASLSVYDEAGRIVRQLVRGPLRAGTCSCIWDGRDVSGRAVNEGVYFVRLETTDGCLSRKLMIVRD